MQCIPRNMLCLDLCAAVQFASETHTLFCNHSPSLKVNRNSVYLSVSMGLKKSIFQLRHSVYWVSKVYFCIFWSQLNAHYTVSNLIIYQFGLIMHTWGVLCFRVKWMKSLGTLVTQQHQHVCLCDVVNRTAWCGTAMWSQSPSVESWV